MRRWGTCPLCHSPTTKLGCENGDCLGLSDEEWAIREVRESYARGDMEIDELEHYLDSILLGVFPRRMRSTLVWR